VSGEWKAYGLDALGPLSIWGRVGVRARDYNYPSSHLLLKGEGAYGALAFKFSIRM